MRSGYNRDRLLDQIACDCFTYLGRNLPQQCASDEFYFLPRAEAALQYLTDIDDVTPEKIQDHVGYVETDSMQVKMNTTILVFTVLTFAGVLSSVISTTDFNNLFLSSKLRLFIIIFGTISATLLSFVSLVIRRKKRYLSN